MFVDSSILNCRIIVIGDTMVGKTSLMNRLVFNKFDEAQSSTVGATHQLLLNEVDGDKLQVQIWDTAGQEKFKSLGPIYFRNSSGAIAVFDETNQESFRNLEEWIKSFTDVAKKNTVIAIAANKSDLPNKTVDFEEAKKWALSNGYLIAETSAKDGIGICDLFKEMTSKLLKILKEGKDNDYPRRQLDAADVNGESKCFC